MFYLIILVSFLLYIIVSIYFFRKEKEKPQTKFLFLEKDIAHDCRF